MSFPSLENLLSKIAPGTAMRDAIDRIVEQGNGGLIACCLLEEIKGIITSGFQMEAD